MSKKQQTAVLSNTFLPRTHCGLFSVNPTFLLLSALSKKNLMCLNPLLKIVPNKGRIYSCLFEMLFPCFAKINKNNNS